MEIVIKIDETTWKRICDSQSVPDMSGIDIINGLNAVKEGAPLPEGHGRLIDADAYLSNEQPVSTSESAWKESHTYKSIADALTILEAR